MTKFKLTSHIERERERERESSLSSLSLKKSFTLIELSIVLLILSLLVGSLLVGRQIVDRAKIQRIIFEFDYYEKAFHQFYDTYRVVPGNLSEKICKKHAVFRNYDGNACNYVATDGSYSLVTHVNNAKLNGSYNTKRSFTHAMHMLYLSGLIDKWDNYKKSPSGSDGDGDGAGDGVNIRWTDADGNECYEGQTYNGEEIICWPWFVWQGISWDEYENEYQNKQQNNLSDMQALFPSSSYDKKIYISFLGWKKIGDNMRVNKGMPSYLNDLGYNEVLNNNWFNNINEHNTIMMKYLESSNNTATSASTQASLNAKLTSELDAKIDDGRPGSGRFLAFKNVNDPQYCYDKTSNEVHLAIYNSDKDNKYGCNIIKVMGDVK